jgi:hypothetical protein
MRLTNPTGIVNIVQQISNLVNFGYLKHFACKLFFFLFIKVNIFITTFIWRKIIYFVQGIYLVGIDFGQLSTTARIPKQQTFNFISNRF